MNTYWFGHDCMGNTPHAVTVEGVCIADIYRDAGERFYNQTTGARGTVARGDDGALHFTPARDAALAALRAAYAAQGLDADAEVDGIDTMTADQLRDELTYLSDYQG